MNGRGKSDRPIRAGKPPNKGRGAPRPAEGVEQRGLTDGNPRRQTRDRAQDRASLQQALERIRQAAEKDRELQFTTLWHHVYDPARLREVYFGLERKASAGVDGETWRSYGEDLEARLQDLSDRLRRGAYRAKPVRRVHIAKEDGRERPLGVPTLEDKIVQGATAEVMNAVYETDFLGFSYGFRPKRGVHNALDALAVALDRRKVNWILDADIRGFFDTIDHGWLEKFVEHRISDQRVVRHLKKWLKAGVLEAGRWSASEQGTPQGGSISPLLANVYLHYVLDQWAQHWRQTRARGEVIIVRYADDFVVGFQHRGDAERFRAELELRLRKFSLELHPQKTRLIEFGRFATANRAKRGEGKPETFDFLGFTHICGVTKKNGFQVVRITRKKRMRAKLKELKQRLRARMHDPVPQVGRWLGSVLTGHYRFYGVPGNYPALKAFRSALVKHWHRCLSQRSQKGRVDWRRMLRLTKRYLPRPQISHPYPNQRLCVTTAGRSPVR